MDDQHKAKKSCNSQDQLQGTRAAVGGQGLEHAGERALAGEARARLFERNVFDQPGAGRFREFRARPGQRLFLGKPRRGRAMPAGYPLLHELRRMTDIQHLTLTHPTKQPKALNSSNCNRTIPI